MMRFINYAVISFLIYISFRVGVIFSDLIYYNMLNESDPFSGLATIRYLLESSCFGVLSSVVGLLYLTFFKIKFQVSYFVVAYSLAVLTLIAIEVRLNSQFPLNVEFWLYTVAIFISIASIMIYLYYLAQNKKINQDRTSSA